MEFRRRNIRSNRRGLRSLANGDVGIFFENDPNDSSEEETLSIETNEQEYTPIESPQIQIEINRDAEDELLQKLERMDLYTTRCTRMNRPVSSVILRRIIFPLRLSRRYHLECEICADDSKRVLFNINHKPAKISEVNIRRFPNNIVPDNTIFLGPCGNHAICKECLVRTIMDTENPPINRMFPLVPCLSLPLGNCETGIGMKIFFDTNHIKKILSQQQFDYYSSLEQRFRFPGYEVIKCPIRQNIFYAQGQICGAENIIPVEEIQTKPRGEIIIFCAQNKRCGARYCYSCFRPVGRADKCNFCAEYSENIEPMAFNFYFYKENRNQGDSVFYRNSELTLEIVMKQIREIAIAPRTFVKCFICLIPILKTEQCNGLSHCSTEICYSCGRSAKNGSTLSEHWSAPGINGCPRWDYDDYWNTRANCNFKCSQGKCYGDTSGGICSVPEHQKGIEDMHLERKLTMIYKKIISIPCELRDQVVQECFKDEQIKEFLPSEDVLEFVKKNNILIVHKAYSERIIFSEEFQEKMRNEQNPSTRPVASTSAGLFRPPPPPPPITEENFPPLQNPEEQPLIPNVPLPARVEDDILLTDIETDIDDDEEEPRPFPRLPPLELQPRMMNPIPNLRLPTPIRPLTNIPVVRFWNPEDAITSRDIGIGNNIQNDSDDDDDEPNNEYIPPYDHEYFHDD